MTSHALKEFFHRAVALLHTGASDNTHPFNRPTFATIGLDGSPQARTVVLRAWDLDARRIVFFTDRRSAKAQELREVRRAAFHFWDPGEQLQLRMVVRSTLHEGDEDVRRYWEALPEANLGLYAQRVAPGTPVPSPDDAWLDRPGAREGFENFAVVESTVSFIDALSISERNRHRRARFEWNDAGRQWTMSWIAP